MTMRSLAPLPVAFGTDAGVDPHGDNGRRFAKLAEWGMTPAQAIRAATADAAIAPDRAGEVGTIAPGRYANLIAVAGDPLKDVGLLAAVRFVMRGGVIDRAPAGAAGGGTGGR